MSDHGSAATAADPVYCITQRDPLMGSIARFSFYKVFPEYRPYILRVTLLNEKTRKVHAADQLSIPCVPASALKTAVNTEFVELCRNIASACRPALADGAQALD